MLVFGTQWGDEGKGKIVDLLTPSFDIVARYQGGHNAGHTVYAGGKKVVLHLIPSGILHPDKLCVIGNGVVLDPAAFIEEVEELRRLGFEAEGRIVISRNTHLIFPYHNLMEQACEKQRGDKKIGTTLRGIGPCYEDKMGRRGIRAGDLLNNVVFKEKIESNVREKNRILELIGAAPLDAGEIHENYSRLADKIKPYIGDAAGLLHEKMETGKSLLLEGAQGTLLDIDHGTYPFVTSSSSSAGGACTGLGISPRRIDSVMGVVKAYVTRVGSGPFPTEIFDDRGAFLASKGNEFGATTGRPRRCGWFDGVAFRYACRLNGIDVIALTKPDVLDELDEILICVGYKYKGELLTNFPTESWILQTVKPVFQSCKGWKKPLTSVRHPDEFPQAFKDYIKRVEDIGRVRVGIVSTGKERDETVFFDDVLRGHLDLKKIVSGLD